MPVPEPGASPGAHGQESLDERKTIPPKVLATSALDAARMRQAHRERVRALAMLIVVAERNENENSTRYFDPGNGVGGKRGRKAATGQSRREWRQVDERGARFHQSIQHESLRTGIDQSVDQPSARTTAAGPVADPATGQPDPAATGRSAAENPAPWRASATAGTTSATTGTSTQYPARAATAGRAAGSGNPATVAAVGTSSAPAAATSAQYSPRVATTPADTTTGRAPAPNTAAVARSAAAIGRTNNSADCLPWLRIKGDTFSTWAASLRVEGSPRAHPALAA